MKIIVKDEKEKEELLRLCNYLHDFGVHWDKKLPKKVRIEVTDFWDGKSTERVKHWECCGVGLDFEKFPLLNLLVGLYDCDEPIKSELIKETIIVQDHINKFQIEE